MSGFGGLIITLTALSPSVGVFVAAPVIIQQSGSFVVVACALAVLLGLVVSGVYAELGSAFPHAGGDYVLIGNTLGPVARFAALAIMIVGFPAGAALSSLGIADFLKLVVPGVEPVSCAIACIVVVTAIAMFSVRMNAWVTGILLAIGMVALVLTGALGFLRPHQDLVQVLLLHPVMAGPHGRAEPTTLLAMGVAGTGAVYALNGYGSAVVFGEEVVGARRKMIWMIYGALGLGALTIIPPLMGVIAGTRDLAKLSASPTPLQDFILASGGPKIAALISAAVALAIFNTVIAVILSGGRVIYAAARENSWHTDINAALSKVHARAGSPWAATLTLGIVSAILCFFPISVLVMINGSGMAVGYSLLALGVIAGRRSGATAKSQAKMPWHPLGPCIVVLVGIVLMATALADNGLPRAGAVVTVGVMAAGALYYLLVVRRAGVWAHHEPDEEEVFIFSRDG
jgi:amino acid transporter